MGLSLYTTCIVAPLSPTRVHLCARLALPQRGQSGVFKLQWYPHDTGMFTSSGADSLLKVWDTNALVVAEQFRFKGRIQTHAVARAKTHCLVAGEQG